MIIDDVGGTKASEPSGEGDKGFDDVDGGGGDYIVDVVDGTQTDDYPEFIVKLNVGVHSYNNPLGV